MKSNELRLETACCRPRTRFERLQDRERPICHSVIHYNLVKIDGVLRKKAERPFTRPVPIDYMKRFDGHCAAVKLLALSILQIKWLGISLPSFYAVGKVNGWW